MLLGIDGADGGMRISSKQGDEAFHFGLGVADEAGAHLVISRLSRGAQGRGKQCKKW